MSATAPVQPQYAVQQVEAPWYIVNLATGRRVRGSATGNKVDVQRQATLLNRGAIRHGIGECRECSAQTPLAVLQALGGCCRTCWDANAMRSQHLDGEHDSQGCPDGCPLAAEVKPLAMGTDQAVVTDHAFKPWPTVPTRCAQCGKVLKRHARVGRIAPLEAE